MSLHKKGKYQKQLKCNIAKAILLLVVLIAVILGSVFSLQHRNNERTLQGTAEGTTKSDAIPYDTKLEEPAQVGTFDDSSIVIQTEHDIEITYLTQAELSVMKEPGLSEFYDDMLSISEEKELSIQEMEIISCNFFYIRECCSAVELNEFNQKSYQVFCNIYNQVIERQLTLDESCYYWSRIPVLDILHIYYASNNFELPEEINYEVFDSLNDEELLSVAEAFFANPTMKVNTHIPRYLIARDCGDAITDKAWQHFENLSQDTSPNTSLSSAEFTSMFYHSLIGTIVNDEDIHKIVNIAEAILENPYYDIKTKYMYFCNAFYDGSKKEYTDATIAFRAIDSLLILAKNADEETRVQLYELVDLLWDDTIADALYDALAENE